MPGYFATGLGGFVGRSLLEKLQSRGPLIALDHSGRLAKSKLPRVVRGSLEQTDTYREALKKVDTVIHLAAATGKSSKRDLKRINVTGTEALVAACRENGVRRIMFVSTIAVKFPDRRNYPYAESKAEAEQIVKQSGLDFVILRPTIVGGRESPVFAGLARLASLPVMPLFNGGRARVQPIHVDDLTRLMLQVLADDPFHGDTIELGGPDVIECKKLLESFRKRIRGQVGLEVNLPLAPLLPLLRILEVLVGPGPLPVTSGQLSSFCFDGVISSNPYYDRCKTSLRNVGEMIAEACPK